MPTIDDIVDVNIVVQSSAITRQGFNSLMLAGDIGDLDTGFPNHGVRQYTSYQGIVDDTDILDGSLKDMAQVAFAQIPAVPVVYLSKIDTTGTAQVSTLTWDADFVTSNSISLEIDSTPVAGSPVVFSGDQATTLALVVAALDAEAGYSVIASGLNAVELTGAIGTTFLTTSTVTLGASQANAAEVIDTPATTTGLITNADLDAIGQNNNDWFGYAQVWNDLPNILVANSWTAANKKSAFFRQTTIGANYNLANKNSSIWYTAGTNTGTQLPLEVAIASKILSLIPGSYTAALQSLELVVTTQLTATDESTLRDEFVNQYSAVSGANITWDGVTSSGGFVDTYIGALYLEARIGEDVFAQLQSVPKVPYTNAGVNLILSAVQNRLNQSVTEGYLTDDPAPVATAPLVSEISAPDKSNRLLPNVSFVAYTAGAIHTVQINGTVIA